MTFGAGWDVAAGMEVEMFAAGLTDQSADAGDFAGVVVVGGSGPFFQLE